LQSDALRVLFIHETKTDSIGAFIIAEVLRIGRYTKTEVLAEKIHALRELCRQRFYVIDMASDIKHKIIALLDQVFPEYEKIFTDTFGVISMKLLANYSLA
jgi:molybdopterin/thiamine biosynthesis adenylyltransferase